MEETWNFYKSQSLQRENSAELFHVNSCRGKKSSEFSQIRWPHMGGELEIFLGSIAKARNFLGPKAYIERRTQDFLGPKAYGKRRARNPSPTSSIQKESWEFSQIPQPLYRRNARNFPGLKTYTQRRAWDFLGPEGRIEKGDQNFLGPSAPNQEERSEQVLRPLYREKNWEFLWSQGPYSGKSLEFFKSHYLQIQESSQLFTTIRISPCSLGLLPL